MTGPVPSLPAALDTSDHDPDPADHWLLQAGHLYRSRLAEDQSDRPEASLFAYEGRAGGLTYFSQRTARAVYYFALPPDALERAFHFHKPGEHDAPVPVHPASASTVAQNGPRIDGDGPQDGSGGVASPPLNGLNGPPAHELIDVSGVVLSRTR